MQTIKRVIIPLFQSYRRNRSRYANMLDNSLEWTPEKAQQIQQDRLAQTLRYCLKEIPFYQERVQIEPNAITAENAEECLLAFPVLTSAMVKMHFDDLQCKVHPKGAFLNRSGGTTGLPTTFFLDQESEDWVRGVKRYHLKAAGCATGQPYWVIWGSSADYQKKKRRPKARLASWINNAEWIHGFSLTENDLDQLLDRMQQDPPRLIHTYTDIMDRLAERAEKTGKTMPQTIHMMVTAGTLYTPIRERIERVFGPALFDCYGSREFGDLALSCKEKKGLHLEGLSHYLEVTDDLGARLPEGESGQILVTSMVNRTMPLVRYAIKDQGSLTTKPCSCGNPWPRLLTIEGRSQDLFYAPDGRKISPNAMVHFCWAYGMEYGTRVQMIQCDYDRLQVHLLKNGQEKKRNEEFEATMQWELENLFNVPLRIELIWKDEMAYTPTGKYRMIQRRMENGGMEK